jgi:hypothetical protein
VDKFYIFVCHTAEISKKCDAKSAETLFLFAEQRKTLGVQSNSNLFARSEQHFGFAQGISDLFAAQKFGFAQIYLSCSENVGFAQKQPRSACA